MVVLAVAAMLAVGPWAAASAQAASHGGAKAKHPKGANVTFGAAPSGPKKPDGRPFFTFSTTPGGRLTDHLAITNFSDKAERLEVYPVDAVPATNGTISFPQRSAPRTAAGAWLAIGTPKHSGSVTIKPRTTDILPVRIIVPANAPPGDHVGAVIVSLTGLVKGKFGQGGTQKVKFDQRLAVRAVFRVTGPAHSLLTIENLKASYDGPISPFARGDAKVSYTVHNGGNIVLGGPQTVTVRGLFGSHSAATGVAVVPPLLPGASYPVTVRVPGVYPELLESAKVTITEEGLQGDLDTGLHPVSSSVHFLAIPWILLIVLLLLILGLAFGYWRRRRRKRQARPADGHGGSPQASGDQPQGVSV